MIVMTGNDNKTIVFYLFFSKETEWSCAANEQSGIGCTYPTAREKEQIFRPRTSLQAVEVEAKKEI